MSWFNNRGVLATLLLSMGLAAAVPQFPSSRAFADSPPPPENRVEKVVSYQRIVNGGLRDDVPVPVADMGTIIRVSHPSFSARQEDEAGPSRGLYAIQLEKIVSRATGSTGNPDLSRLQVYYPQGSLVLAVPERINIVNIGIYRAGQPFPAEPSFGYDAIRELIQRGVEKTTTKHPFVALVAGLLERYAKAPEPQHPSFRNEGAYDITTFLWDGIPTERCEGDVVIKIDAEYEEGFDSALDKIYACLRVEETIEDPSAPTEKIIKLTNENSTTPRQVEFAITSGGNPVQVIGAESNREASLAGREDVGADEQPPPTQATSTGSGAEALEWIKDTDKGERRYSGGTRIYKTGDYKKIMFSRIIPGHEDWINWEPGNVRIRIREMFPERKWPGDNWNLDLGGLYKGKPAMDDHGIYYEPEYSRIPNKRTLSKQELQELRDKYTRMVISPFLNPEDGVLDGIIIPKREGDNFIVTIFLDEDWRRLGQVNIRWGQSIYDTRRSNTREFDWRLSRGGVYVDSVTLPLKLLLPPDSYTPEELLSLASPGVVVGNFSRDKSLEENMLNPGHDRTLMFMR